MESVIRSIRGWPDEVKGPYRIEIHLAIIRGRLECVGLLIGHLAGWPPDEDPSKAKELAEPRPIPASLLRQISLPDLIGDDFLPIILADEAASDPAQWLEGYQDTPQRAARALASLEARGARRGRKGHPPEHFVEVAAVYRDAYRFRRPPTQAVADHWTVSKSTAAKWVAKARDRGLLPPTSRGKPSA